MNQTVAGPADPQKTADVEEESPAVESLDSFLREIEERASTQTRVLLEALERQEKFRWRYWGINE